MAYYIKMNQILDMPMVTRFCNYDDYKELESIINVLKNKKTVIKVLNELKEFSDYKYEVIMNYRIKNFMECFKEQTPYVLSIIKKFIDTIHQIKDILPIFIKEKKDLYIQIINKIKKYKKEDFLDVLYYINYPIIQKYILQNKSKKEILYKIEIIKKGLLKANQSKKYRKEYGPNYKELLKKLYTDETSTYISKTQLIDKLKFIKNPILASFWGKETKCCLRKGGVAEKLIDVIEKSPIAGEIVGTLEGDKMSSFTWDYVEVKNGKAYKTLVLDNIESPVEIKKEKIEKLFNNIMYEGNYKKLYVGTIRNDFKIDDKYKKNIYKRQSTVPGFDKLFTENYYMGADSASLYKLRENKTDNNINVRQMSLSDLHLCKYIEKYIYGKDIYLENDPTDILKQVLLDTPCYILDSKTNIWGYILTKWKYLDEEGRETDNKKAKNRKLYIEDIVLTKNRNVILKLEEIILDFVYWCNQNNITEVYANTNKYSRNLTKRLKQFGIEFKEEILETIEPKNFLK